LGTSKKINREIFMKGIRRAAHCISNQRRDGRESSSGNKVSKHFFVPTRPTGSPDSNLISCVVLIAIRKSANCHAAGEKTIETGRKTFVEVGLALAEIRDSRLYRSDHATFEEYCRTKWGWDRTYCHRIIEASKVVKLLPIGNTAAVTSESQARELAKVEPEKRVEVLKVAQESKWTRVSILGDSTGLVRAAYSQNNPTCRRSDLTKSFTCAWLQI
jgi:hypothetical protein